MKRLGLKLIGAGYALPERVVTSDELEKMTGFEEFGIRKGMSKLLSGVSERRFAADDENSSDYAIRSEKMALANANIKPEDIDLLLFFSITSDFMEPATSMKIREKMGCINANCYDGIMWGGGTCYAHQPEMSYFRNESKEMIKTNFGRAMEFYSEAMKKFEIKREDVSLFIPHQITKYLTLKTIEILGIPVEKTVDQVGIYGNNGCASIPLAIAQAVEKGTLSFGSGQQIILFGFGNGISMTFISMNI